MKIKIVDYNKLIFQSLVVLVILSFLSFFIRIYNLGNEVESLSYYNIPFEISFMGTCSSDFRHDNKSCSEIIRSKFSCVDFTTLQRKLGIIR